MAAFTDLLPWRRRSLPPALVSALDGDERIQVLADCTDGKVLGASRFGLWIVDHQTAARLGWETIAKARLTAQVLVITATRTVDQWADGTLVLIDEAPREFVLAGRSGLTDVVHTRVRRSVAASRHLPYPGAGGWVVLRRVPGRDGLTRQVRLDPGADPDAPGFPQAANQVAGELAASALNG